MAVWMPEGLGELGTGTGQRDRRIDNVPLIGLLESVLHKAVVPC